MFKKNFYWLLILIALVIYLFCSKKELLINKLLSLIVFSIYFIVSTILLSFFYISIISIEILILILK